MNNYNIYWSRRKRAGVDVKDLFYQNIEHIKEEYNYLEYLYSKVSYKSRTRCISNTYQFPVLFFIETLSQLYNHELNKKWQVFFDLEQNCLEINYNYRNLSERRKDERLFANIFEQEILSKPHLWMPKNMWQESNLKPDIIPFTLNKIDAFNYYTMNKVDIATHPWFKHGIYLIYYLFRFHQQETSIYRKLEKAVHNYDGKTNWIFREITDFKDLAHFEIPFNQKLPVYQIIPKEYYDYITYCKKHDLYNKGLPSLLKAEQINPKDIIVLYNIAYAYRNSENKTKAIEYYEKIIEYADENMAEDAKEQLKKLKE